MIRLIQAEHSRGLSPAALFRIHEGTATDSLEHSGYVLVRMIGSLPRGGNCIVFDAQHNLQGAVEVTIADASPDGLRQAAISALRRGLPGGAHEDIC
ncbi:MAG TPA: hypothetical protein VFP84_13635 [Kofleriaceae bacterium]|nr:hypothetical protein [Kofleriaceae bacterium]